MLGKCQQKAIAEEALTSAFEKKASRSAIACPEAFYRTINLVATGILVIDSDNAISQIKILTHFLGTDELQTFIGNKKNKVWVWTVVNHWQPGILLCIVGDCEASRRHRSSTSFQIIWSIIRCWHSFWYVTDGWKVYPGFIEPEDHLVSKTYMTRVEGENTRLRHYLARLHRKTLCYSKSIEMLRYSIRLLLHYLKFKTIIAIA